MIDLASEAIRLVRLAYEQSGHSEFCPAAQHPGAYCDCWKLDAALLGFCGAEAQAHAEKSQAASGAEPRWSQVKLARAAAERQSGSGGARAAQWSW